jgi:hypothetical protein
MISQQFVVDSLTVSERATKANSLSDDELEFSESNSALMVTLRALLLFYFKLRHSLLK